MLTLVLLAQLASFEPPQVVFFREKNVMKEVARNGVARSVTVTGEGFRCSGFVYETGFVLTAGHCFNDDKPDIKVDDKPATVARAARFPDLMLLACETAKFAKLKIEEAEVSDQVILVGNYADKQGVVSFGYVSFSEAYSFLISSMALPGVSGSPIYSTNGALVGVETKYTGMTTDLGSVIVFGQAIKGILIKKFLEAK